MKKILYLAAALAAAAAMLCGCAKKTNYADYISEKRYAVYLYEDDAESIKIYCSEKESPFVADGVKGKTTTVTEIYAKLSGEPETVNISGGGITGGEMSYMTVRDCWYLSCGETIEGDSAELTVVKDGAEKTYTLPKAGTGGALTCEQALDCVTEHDRQLFDSLTVNGIFEGEIFVRMIYDGACYYYVGVCGRDSTVHAYLVDGASGRIIAEREHRI